MRGKGQVTIPVSIREALHLSENSILSVAKVGDGILITTKPSLYEKISTDFRKEADKKGITLDELLRDLKKIRREKKS
jgi:AbrB family looped-hinge helix DNA binding protein